MKNSRGPHKRLPLSRHRRTGLWLGEATEFVEEVTKAGFSVDYVSPQGGYVPLDPRSMKYVDSSIMAVYESADFQERALAHSLLKKLSQMNTQQFTLQEAMALCGTFLIILSCKQSLVAFTNRANT